MSSEKARSKRQGRGVRLWVAAIILVAGGCFGWFMAHREPGGERWRTSQVDAIREAVIRYQIGRHRRNNEVCFITVRGPAGSSEALVRRLADCPFARPLPAERQGRPDSPMTIRSAKTGGFADAATSAPALHFWVGDLDWESDHLVSAAGGGAAASVSGDQGVFSVVWRNGKWVVTEYQVRLMM